MKRYLKIYPDKASDILWIVFKKGTSDYYEEIAPGVNVEFDEQKKVIGLEILNISRLLEQNTKTKNEKIYYEAKDDILSIFLSKKSFDDADDTEIGIIHYTEEDEPAYIEMLNASKTLKKYIKKSIPNPKNQKFIPNQSVLHRVK